MSGFEKMFNMLGAVEKLVDEDMVQYPGINSDKITCVCGVFRLHLNEYYRLPSETFLKVSLQLTEWLGVLFGDFDNDFVSEFTDETPMRKNFENVWKHITSVKYALLNEIDELKHTGMAPR